MAHCPIFARRGAITDETPPHGVPDEVRDELPHQPAVPAAV